MNVSETFYSEVFVVTLNSSSLIKDLICGPTKMPSLIFASDNVGNSRHRHLKLSFSLFRALTNCLIKTNLISSGGKKILLRSIKFLSNILVSGSSLFQRFHYFYLLYSTHIKNKDIWRNKSSKNVNKSKSIKLTDVIHKIK